MYADGHLIDETVSVLQPLNQALVSPVQVSQILYKEGYISSVTLDEMEKARQGHGGRSLDDKKLILLNAMQELVFSNSNYLRLKDIALVLSHYDETKEFALRMMAEYGKLVNASKMIIIMFM